MRAKRPDDRPSRSVRAGGRAPAALDRSAFRGNDDDDDDGEQTVAGSKVVTGN